MHMSSNPARSRFAALIGASDAIAAVRDLIDHVAGSPASVLITGPSGSGKDIVAELLHQRGARAAHPFVAINCAALSCDLLDSELFGHAAEPFTGVIRCGRKLVEGGTLFLDELSDMPADAQAKLLRILETRQVERLGDGPAPPVGVRVVAATNVDLAAAIEAGRFRADLFYRLAVVEIAMPSLAERADDIPLLIEYFASIEADRGPCPRFTAAALAYLLTQPWPGNVRELRNFVSRAAACHPGGEIDDQRAAILLHGERRAVDRWLATAAAPLPMPNRRRPQPFVAAGEAIDLKVLLTDFEQAYIREALGRTASGVAETAQLLGLRQTTSIENRRRLTTGRPDEPRGV